MFPSRSGYWPKPKMRPWQKCSTSSGGDNIHYPQYQTPSKSIAFYGAKNACFTPRRREEREILRRSEKVECAGTRAGPPALKYDFRMVLFFPETPDFGDNGFRDPKQRLLVADAKGCQHGNLLIERRCNLGEGEKEVMSRLLDLARSGRPPEAHGRFGQHFRERVHLLV